MPKWWRNNKSKTIPMSIPNDPTISSNEDNPKKKTRSLVSFFLDKQTSDTKPIKNDSIFPTQPSIPQKPDPTMTYSRGESIIPNQWRTTQSMLKSPTYHDIPIKTQQNLIFDHHSYGYLELFDELINENTSCFGFSLSHITSKSCLYLTIITFLGICLIISFTVILKK